MTEPVATGGVSAGAPGELASYGERFLAFLIDVGVLIGIGIVLGLVGFVAGKIAGILSVLVTLCNIVVNIGYFIYLWGVDNPITGRGQTIGKKVMNIKIIKEDGSDIDVGGAVLRYLGYIVSEVVILLGFIWIFIDDRNQGWHDKIAKTLVVKS